MGQNLPNLLISSLRGAGERSTGETSMIVVKIGGAQGVALDACVQ